MSKKRFGDDLLLDINPDYDFSCDPFEQPECVNPVHANNKLIILGNTLITLSQKISAANIVLVQKKSEKRNLENAVQTIEEEILRRKPPSQTQVKTLKLQASYIHAMAEQLQLTEPLQLAEKNVRELEDDIALLEMRIKNAKGWVETIKAHGDHIKTFLSFVKEEARRAAYNG